MLDRFEITCITLRQVRTQGEDVSGFSILGRGHERLRGNKGQGGSKRNRFAGGSNRSEISDLEVPAVTAKSLRVTRTLEGREAEEEAVCRGEVAMNQTKRMETLKPASSLNKESTESLSRSKRKGRRRRRIGPDLIAEARGLTDKTSQIRLSKVEDESELCTLVVQNGKNLEEYLVTSFDSWRRRKK